MIIQNKKLIDDFIQTHALAKSAMNKWLFNMEEADWANHNDLKKDVPSVDYVGNGHYVFNIGGNKFRIIVIVIFVCGVMNIRFVGTHSDYDKIKNCSII